MSPEQEALACRAVACAAWRWMPGMLAVGRDVHPGLRLGMVADGGDALNEPHEDGGPRWLPDLTDAATIGCLLALVREAYADGDGIHVTPISADQWIVHGARSPDPEIDGLWIEGPTEAAALVAALDAAPVRR